MKIPELNIEVDGLEDFEDTACQMLDEYCMGLAKDPTMLKEITEGDPVPADDYITHLWQPKAMKLIEAEISHLATIGYKYFGEDADFEIKSSQYQEI